MVEADFGGLLTEATSAEHQIILANETTTVSTGTATSKLENKSSKAECTYHEREPGPYSRGWV